MTPGKLESSERCASRLNWNTQEKPPKFWSQIFSQYHNLSQEMANYGYESHQGDLHEDTEGFLRGGFSGIKSIPSFPYSTLHLTPPQCLND